MADVIVSQAALLAAVQGTGEEEVTATDAVAGPGPKLAVLTSKLIGVGICVRSTPCPTVEV